MVEKDRFPDPRCAPQPQRPAAFVARIRQQALNPRLLDVPSHQRHAVTLDGRCELDPCARSGRTRTPPADAFRRGRALPVRLRSVRPRPPSTSVTQDVRSCRRANDESGVAFVMRYCRRAHVSQSGAVCC
nr:hypothetical protein [Kibdelosporangium sp. MJ126-NF4]CTQ90841.1 hypothetical protein [Kibdelosporangium sp. MJ126-NF4]